MLITFLEIPKNNSNKVNLQIGLQLLYYVRGHFTMANYQYVHKCRRFNISKDLRLSRYGIYRQKMQKMKLFFTRIINFVCTFLLTVSIIFTFSLRVTHSFIKWIETKDSNIKVSFNDVTLISIINDLFLIRVINTIQSFQTFQANKIISRGLRTL